MSSAAKVGLFALIVIFIAGIFILKIEDLSLWGGRLQRITVTFPDVSGLDAKAAVRVHGVRVGKVEKILLRQGYAEAVLAVDSSLKLGKGATAAVRNMGLLGDKYVELIPGNPDLGPLETPGRIAGSSPVSYDEILSKIDAIGDNVKALTSSFRVSLAGPEAEGRMKEIVENIRSLTAEANRLVAENRGTVHETAENIREITARLKADLPEVLANARTLLDHLDTIVVDNRAGLSDTVKSLRDSTAKLETTMKSVDNIVGKIDRGEGTIGKLINSSATHDRLLTTMDSIKGGADSLTDSLGRVQRWKLNVGYEDIYLTKISDTRTQFTLQLSPLPDRFYLLQVANDPYGKRTEYTKTDTTTNPDGSITTTTTHQLKYDQAMTITFEHGWRYAPWVFRIGMKDGHGAVGMDSLLMKDRLQFSLDAWDFSRPENNFRLMVEGKYYITKRIFLSTGVDDILLKTHRSFFFGAGLAWPDEDFKYLFGAAKF